MFLQNWPAHSCVVCMLQHPRKKIIWILLRPTLNIDEDSHIIMCIHLVELGSIYLKINGLGKTNSLTQILKIKNIVDVFLIFIQCFF